MGGVVTQLGQRTRLWKNQWPPLTRNTALLAVLLGGATGSFLGAVTAGKNQVHHLHPIFQRGANPPPDDTYDDDDTYEQSLQRAKNREDVLRSMELSRVQRETSERVLEGDQHAAQEERERNRLFRRRTLDGSLAAGRGGLSDSHGGHWVNDDLERQERERNRLYRRESLQKSLTPGRGGLSDSHGGHWIKDDNTREK